MWPSLGLSLLLHVLLLAALVAVGSPSSKREAGGRGGAIAVRLLPGDTASEAGPDGSAAKPALQGTETPPRSAPVPPPAARVAVLPRSAPPPAPLPRALLPQPATPPEARPPLVTPAPAPEPTAQVAGREPRLAGPTPREAATGGERPTAETGTGGDSRTAQRETGSDGDGADTGGSSAGAGVDRAALPASPIRPRYPARARERGDEADVLVDVWVDGLGGVSDAAVAQSAGADFDRAALAAVRSARFHPALRSGRPVPSRVALRLHFRLDR